MPRIILPCLLYLSVLMIAGTLATAQQAPPSAPPAPEIFASFESDADNPFTTNEAKATRVEQNATHGRWSLKVEILGADKQRWPALWYFPKPAVDWSTRQRLVMDIFVETKEPFTLGAQMTNEGQAGWANAPLADLLPGWNRGVGVTLRDFNRSDLGHVAALALFVSSPKSNITYYVDNVRWERQAQSAVSETGEASGWLNVKDFGASGSQFETKATTTADSREITVAEVGDFAVGQQVTVSRCNIRYLRATRWGPGEPYATAVPLGDQVEVRGYDGSTSSWLTYLLEVDAENPVTFRWKNDLAKDWTASRVPVTYDWQPLADGIEVRFKKQEWKPGHLITFSARDQLTTTIVRIEGKTLTVKDAPNRSATDAIVRHTDRAACQNALDQAARRKCHVYFPAGHYRIPGGLTIAKPAGLVVQGCGANTVLDISDGTGSCFSVSGGTECTIRNFTMIGHTGLAEAPRSFQMTSGYSFWPNGLKGCNAVGMSGVERMLIENVHVSRMANEAFYAQGPARAGSKEPAQYQKELTYLRCSVTDCAANAFNNNDRAENTSILYCRVDGAGWHAAEMPARFLRVIGSYFRNTGAITVGDMSHRYEDLNELGCGEAIVSGNVFEGIGRCGGVAINHGSSQVSVTGNLFINFNGPAITISSATVRPKYPWYKPEAALDWGSYPSRSAVVSGNIIDMTCVGEQPALRRGITCDANDVTISDNQIYVRGECDPKVIGILLREPALNVIVHDNLIRNCGTGLATGRALSRVSVVIDPTTFMEASLPLEWRYSHGYRGWNLVWLSGNEVKGTSVLEGYDPGTLQFKLKAPREMKVGDAFEVYPPGGNNWNIHHNTFTGCGTPVIFDSYGSESTSFARNTISRGETVNVTRAMEVRGLVSLVGNQFAGFNEPGCLGLLIYPDRFGQPIAGSVQDNDFVQCAVPIGESVAGLWAAMRKSGNSFTECGAGLR